MDNPALQIDRLSFSYPDRLALNNINLTISKGEIFGLLGPNGGGKTTLFKILSTTFRPETGSVFIFGKDIKKDFRQIRKEIGVVFQNPSLDKKLTVAENLMHQAHLYGIHDEALRLKITELMRRFNVFDRAQEKVEFLSGGLARRLEIAKSMLHSPKLLLMDEPSTGLDPGVRRDLWDLLRELKGQGATILITTHLTEEAERCDRLGILNEGELVALGTPQALKEEIGGDVVVIEAKDSKSLSKKIQSKFKIDCLMLENSIRIEKDHGAEFVPQLAKEFGAEISSIMVGKPTLEDVFIHRTGHKFWNKVESS